MAKIIKISVKCPKCASSLIVPIVEEEIGTKKQNVCQKCGQMFTISVPASLASQFNTDPTLGGLSNNDISLRLEVLRNDATPPQAFNLTADYYTVGRKNNSGPASRPDIEVVTTDMKMSRKHAIIKKKGNNGFTIKDAGSKNGIKVNGQKMTEDEELYLNDGDMFQLGITQFRVYVEKSK